ncbi:MAG: carboxypeptidase regulatory-like domain-containing protein, partial [Bacteroidota bacterium]
RISRDFASRAQAASVGKRYFVDRHNGITNGHDWYPIAGSRQDYMNYYHRCREATLEVSNAKRFPAYKLGQLWQFVHPALLAFIGEARYGLHGTVTDAETGLPVKANILIPGHDEDHSDIFADGVAGDYYRFLAAGNYQVAFSAPGYITEWQNITVRDGQRTVVHVQMRPSQSARKK